MKFGDNCIVKRGVFPESAEGCTEERFAFVSIDADLYNPIYEGLNFFYPRLSSTDIYLPMITITANTEALNRRSETSVLNEEYPSFRYPIAADPQLSLSDKTYL